MFMAVSRSSGARSFPRRFQFDLAWRRFRTPRKRAGRASAMIARNKLMLVFGYALSAACIAVLATRADCPASLAHLRTARPLPVAAAVILVTITYLFFALRWRLLLSF